VQVLERLHLGYGIAVMRIMTGVVLLVAGMQKWTGPGVAGISGFFGNVGIPAPAVMAPLLMGFELIGGLLLIVGAFSRPIGLIMIVQFLVAGLLVSLPSQGGWNAARTDFLLLASGAMLLLAGAGLVSVDAWRSGQRPRATAEMATSP
jgi:putative oxidoreductase